MTHASFHSLRTRSGALTYTSLLTLLAFAPAKAAAEEDTGTPVQYEVIEDPEPAQQTPPPPPPDQYGQQPTVYVQPAQPQGVTTGPVVTTQAQPAVVAAPARPAYRTGLTGGLFLSYSPEGRIANYDSSSTIVSTADFPSTLGFGGHFGGLGRHFGGGLQARVVWVYDLDGDSSWSITDVHGMLRGRGRWGIFEFYGEGALGFSVQRAVFDFGGGSTFTDSSGGLSFGAGLGFKIFATETISFFIEPGMMWRIFFRDVTAGDDSSFGTRQFTLEAGINFGA